MEGVGGGGGGRQNTISLLPRKQTVADMCVTSFGNCKEMHEPLLLTRRSNKTVIYCYAWCHSPRFIHAKPRGWVQVINAGESGDYKTRVQTSSAEMQRRRMQQTNKVATTTANLHIVLRADWHRLTPRCHSCTCYFDLHPAIFYLQHTACAYRTAAAEKSIMILLSESRPSCEEPVP